MDPDVPFDRVTTRDEWLDNDPARLSVIEDGYWIFKRHLDEVSHQDICDKLDLDKFLEMVFSSSSGCPES